MTFLQRVKLQSQQTSNGFESKHGIIWATVGYLSEGGGGSVSTFFLEGGVIRLILCRTGQGSFLRPWPIFYWIDSRATFCLLSVGRHSSISIVLECWLAYTDKRLKIDVVSTGLLGRFWQIGWWTSDHVYELRETYSSLTVDKRLPDGRRRLAADICVNDYMVIGKWSAICEIVDYVINQQYKSNYQYGLTMTQWWYDNSPTKKSSNVWRYQACTLSLSCMRKIHFIYVITRK